MLTRRTALAGAIALLAVPAFAHHGLMIWDKENLVIVEGVVTEEMDGYPHWEITVRAEGEDWLVDIGSDFELERAGFSADGREFTPGAKIRVEGYRPKDSDTRLMRPQRMILNGKTYEFVTDGY